MGAWSQLAHRVRASWGEVALRHTRGTVEGGRTSRLDTFFFPPLRKITWRSKPNPLLFLWEKDSRVVGSVSAWSCLTKSLDSRVQGEPGPEEKEKKKKSSLLEQSPRVLTGCHSTDEIYCTVFTPSKPLAMVLGLFPPPAAEGTHAHSDICRIRARLWTTWSTNSTRSSNWIMQDVLCWVWNSNRRAFMTTGVVDLSFKCMLFLSS